jgi:hypothetical protein
MTYSNDDYRGVSLGSLDDTNLYRIVDGHGGEWKELPDDREFRHLEVSPRPKRFAKLRAKLKAVIAKTRRQRRIRRVLQPA